MNSNLNTDQATPSRADTARRFLHDRRADAVRITTDLRDRLRDVDWADMRYLGGGGGVVGVAAVLGTLALIVLAITGVVGAVRSVDVASIAQRVIELPAVRLVLDPITGYITRHAADLPYAISPAALTAGWFITCGVLLVLAWIGSRGARIGWVLAGAVSVAMAYAGSTALHAPIAAGATVAAWMAGTVLAFTRYQHHRAVHTVVVPTHQDHHRPAAPRSSTPTTRPVSAEQRDLMLQCEGRTEQLLFQASLSDTDRDKQSWTQASQAAVDLLHLLRSGRYRATYVHTVLEHLDPASYTAAPTNTDLGTVRIYLALAEIDH